MFPACQVLDIIDFCHEQPEIRSWLDFFDDPSEEALVGDPEEGPADGALHGAGDDSEILL